MTNMTEREIGRLEEFARASEKWQEKADARFDGIEAGIAKIEIHMAEEAASRRANRRTAAGIAATISAGFSAAVAWFTR